MRVKGLKKLRVLIDGVISKQQQSKIRPSCKEGPLKRIGGREGGILSVQGAWYAIRERIKKTMQDKSVKHEVQNLPPQGEGHVLGKGGKKEKEPASRQWGPRSLRKKKKKGPKRNGVPMGVLRKRVALYIPSSVFTRGTYVRQGNKCYAGGTQRGLTKEIGKRGSKQKLLMKRAYRGIGKTLHKKKKGGRRERERQIKEGLQRQVLRGEASRGKGESLGGGGRGTESKRALPRIWHLIDDYDLGRGKMMGKKIG